MEPRERGKTREKEKFEVTRHTALLRKLKSETHCRLASKKKESSENGWFMKKVKELNKTQQLASHKSWNEILEAAATRTKEVPSILW